MAKLSRLADLSMWHQTLRCDSPFLICRGPAIPESIQACIKRSGAITRSSLTASRISLEMALKLHQTLRRDNSFYTKGHCGSPPAGMTDIKRSDAIARSSPLLTTDISRSGTRHQTLRRDSPFFTSVSIRRSNTWVTQHQTLRRDSSFFTSLAPESASSAL